MKPIRARILALFLALTMCLGLMPISVTAASTQIALQGDETDGYYVNLPETGEVTLNLTDQADGFRFHIYDCGGASGDYTNSNDCTLLVTAPTGYAIRISGEGELEDQYDKLFLYDRNTTTPLGEQYYTGSVIVEEMYLKNNSFTVKFQSDRSQVETGFVLDVTLVDVSGKNWVTYFYNEVSKCFPVESGATIVLQNFSDLFSTQSLVDFYGWQCGQELYQEQEAFAVEEDVTLYARTSGETVLEEDGESGYYALMPTEGTSTLYLSDAEEGFTFHLYDDGGVDQDYVSDCSGTLRIVAPEDTVLRFSGSGETESGYDALTLYDGDTDFTFVTSKSGDLFTVSETFTSGNVLKLFFLSDASEVRSGFDLTITVFSRSSTASIAFDAGEGSGTMHTIRDVLGSTVTIPECGFTSPVNCRFASYTDGETTYHPNEEITLNEDKTLTALYAEQVTIIYVFGDKARSVTALVGTTIELRTFDSLFTLPDRQIFKGWQLGDALYQGGDSFTVPGETTFTAVLEDAPLIGHSDEYENYSLVPQSENITVELSDVPDEYALWIFDCGGPTGNYVNNCDGSITVQAPEDCILYITTEINTEVNFDKLYVYDGVYDGDWNALPTLLDAVSGSATLDPVYSSGSAATVRFKSDGGTVYAGFKMQVLVLKTSNLVRASFDPGEGSGEMTDVYRQQGDSFTLPPCTFTPPDGKLFDCYTDGVETYQVGDTLVLEENLTLTAVYLQKITVTYQHGEQTAEQAYKLGESFFVASFDTFFSLPYRTMFQCWMYGEEEIDADTLLYANEDMTLTPKFNHLPILIADGSGGFYATLPINEHVAVDLTDKPNGFIFQLYDNGGPSQNYSNNCDCSFTCTAPDGYLFSVSGSYRTASSEDYLTLYDSDLTTFLGQGRYSNARGAEIPTLDTTGNVLKLSFYSNAVNTATGLDLRIMLFDPDSVITVSFAAGAGSGTMESMRVFAGSPFILPTAGFTAPEGQRFLGYSDGTDVYPAGSSVTFDSDTALTAIWANPITLTFSYDGTSQTFEYPQGATINLPDCDGLITLPAGMSLAGWRVAGTEDVYLARSVFVVTEPTAFEAVPDKLACDANGMWSARMPFNNGDTEWTIDLTDKEAGFSFTLYDEGGPYENYWNNNTSSKLSITAPANVAISVSGSGQIEAGSDFLRFFDSDTDDESKLLGDVYSGTFAISSDVPLETSGNHLTVCFHSDWGVNYEGYALTISLVARNTVDYVFGDETIRVLVEPNTEITLAAFDDLFDADDCEFLYWEYADDAYDEAQTFLVTEDVTFTAVIRPLPTVTLNGNGVTVKGDNEKTEYGPIPIRTGSTYQLPHANSFFAIPEGTYFGGWSYDGEIYGVGETITVNEDVVFTAVWREACAWDAFNEFLQAKPGTSLGIYTLSDDITAEIGSLPLTVPEGVSVTIDLFGHMLNGEQAAVLSGNAMEIYGNLTFIDSDFDDPGAVTGGNCIVIETGQLEFDETSARMFTATMTQGYEIEDIQTGAVEENVYAVTYCPSFARAMTAAESSLNFKNRLTFQPDEEISYFRYRDAVVTLLKDAMIDECEAVVVNDENVIVLDLNGHTLDVRGTWTGGTNHMRYDSDCDGWYETVEPTSIHVCSATTPGSVRISGFVDVEITALTQDTYYIMDGYISGFFEANGGIFHISGGCFRNAVSFTNEEAADEIEIHLSGNAEIQEICYTVWADPTYPKIQMTINDAIRIGEMRFQIVGDEPLTDPVLTVNGGYFSEDPRNWRDLAAGGDETVVPIQGEPELFEDQADWTADSTIYTWRLGNARVTGNSISLKDEIGVNFYVWLPDGFDSTNATVRFNWGAGDSAHSAEGELQFVLEPFKFNGANYRTSCSIAARHMTDAVTMTLTYGEKTLTDSFSVSEYATLAKESYAGNEELMQLLCDMLDYGGAVQAFFGYQTDDSAESHIHEINSDWTRAARVTDLDNPTAIPDDSVLADYGLQYEYATLLTTSKTGIRLYFSVTDQALFEGTSATLEENALSFKKKDGYRYLEISGIVAEDIFKPYTLTLTNGADSVDIVYCAADYYNAVMAMDDDDPTVSYSVPNLKAVLAAMYQYYLSADCVL